MGQKSQWEGQIAAQVYRLEKYQLRIKTNRINNIC